MQPLEFFITLCENISHVQKEDEKNNKVNTKSIQQKVFKRKGAPERLRRLIY